MKNLFPVMLILLITIVFGESGCNKISTVNTDKPVIDAQISNAKSAMDFSHAYNDTLVIHFDTTIVRNNNADLIKFDKLYHHWDSVFGVQYNLFGGELYKYGKVMIGYTPDTVSRSMVFSDGMTTDELTKDTIVMHDYYSNMQQLRATHKPYHDSIYVQMP